MGNTVPKEDQEPSSETVYAEVGLLFQEERKRRNLTIQDVCAELHIRQLYIKSIEQGKLSELPGYVYIIGFIKSYAGFLELDTQEILRRLDLGEKIKDKPILSNLPVSADHQQHPSLKVLFASLTLLFVSGLGIYIYGNSNQIETTETEQNDATEITPTYKASSNHEVNPASIKNMPSSNSQEESPLEPIEIKQSPSQETTVPASPTNLHNEDNIVSTLPKKHDEITVLAFKDSWVQISNTKGKNIFVRLMHAGEKYTPPQDGDNSYILNTGNGGGIKIILNGQETKPLGEDGKILRGISLTSEVLKDYLPPNEAPEDPIS